MLFPLSTLLTKTHIDHIKAMADEKIFLDQIVAVPTHVVEDEVEVVIPRITTGPIV